MIVVLHIETKHHNSISKDIKGSWTLPNKSQLDTCFVFVPIIYPAIWHKWIQQKNTKVATLRLQQKNILLRILLTVNLGFLDPKELNPRESKNIDEWVASEMIMATWVKRNPKTIKSGFSWSREQNTQNKKERFLWVNYDAST